MNKNLSKFAISIALTLFVGFLGSLFTTPYIQTWYAKINKPSFNPPNSVFGPVWTILFILMGISLAIVWTKKKAKKERAYFFFGLQLFFNLLWSFTFFKSHSPFLAMIDIVILWFLILQTILEFKKIDKKAAYLLIPYILWVSFASILNFFVWKLNQSFF